MTTITCSEDVKDQLQAHKQDLDCTWDELLTQCADLLAGEHITREEASEPTDSNVDISEVLERLDALDRSVDDLEDHLKDFGISIPAKTAERTAAELSNHH